MRWFMKLLGLRPKPRNAYEEILEIARVVIPLRYREIAAARGCAPTSKTSDDRIMEIYQKVGTAFREASLRRGENLRAGVLNRIVLKFLNAYELLPRAFADEHLQYEVDRYLRLGLRSEYLEEIDMFEGLE